MLTKLSILVGGVSAASLSNDSFLRAHAEPASEKAPNKPTSPEPTSQKAAKKSSSGKPSVRASELPIYGDPEPTEFELVEDKPSAYFTAVSDARKWVWTYKDSIQSGADKVTHAYEVVKNGTKDGLQYIQKDSAALPRAVVISVAGLGGIVAGYRGGFLRKTFYASIAMTGAAAICYPDQAVDISKRGWKSVRDLAVTAYRDNVSPGTTDKGSKQATSSGEGRKGSQTSEKVQPKPSDVKPNLTNDSPAPKKDFGMSNPEDKDMYTTRGK